VEPTFVGTLISGEPVDMRNYIGLTIHLCNPRKGGTYNELDHPHKVVAENAEGFSTMMKRSGARFVVVEPVAEVTEMAIESVEKKATRKGKKVAAA